MDLPKGLQLWLFTGQKLSTFYTLKFSLSSLAPTSQPSAFSW